MSNKDNQPQYQQLANKPIACTYCGAEVHGRIQENYNPNTKKTEKLCKWNCSRCGNVVRVGRI